jgi:hypothetical protein
LLSGLVFIDVPLAVFATLAATYLIDWMDGGSPGALVMAALAAGLMPWTKREGLALLMVLCLAALITGRSVWRRAWRGVGAALLAAALLSGPWWVFVAWSGGTTPDFMPITAAALQANISRLPTIAWMASAELLSPNWNLLWPLAVLCGLTGWAADREQYLTPKGHTTALLPLTILLYLGGMCLGYVFSTFAPYQEHIESSLFRLFAHTVPMLVLWLACQGVEAPETI